MFSNKLISFNTKLSSDFVKYIENTNNLCIYKLGSHYIPNNIIFDKATTLTLINCNKDGIHNILNPRVFPNITNINYLSVHPGDYNIYKRFSENISWKFPNKDYEFYNKMVSNGRGKKYDNLIKEYLTNKRIIDGKNGFDISFYFDLIIPNYGITDGEWWQLQFYEYLVRKEKELHKRLILQETEEQQLQSEYMKSILDVYQSDNIM
jgi:hypothetical protein